jgi:MFS family permease
MRTKLGHIYTASFVFSLGLSLAAYVNSTFLAHVVGERYVGILYSIGAAATILTITHIGRALNRHGNKFVAYVFLTVIIASLLVFSLEASAFIIAVMFIFYTLSNDVVNFTFDIFIRHYSTSKITGHTRGIYLTIYNIAWLFGPFVATLFLTSEDSFSHLYTLVLALFMIVVVLLRTTVTHFVDKKYERLPLFSAIHYIRKNRNLLRIVMVNFILQFFYAWMVVYTPLYLTTTVGLSWHLIGIIFTIMLLPFALFQYPLGILFDRYGEKRFIFIGLLIMAFSTFAFAYTTGSATSIWPWALVLFCTRVGAAIVEMGVETYFFKKVTDREASIIGVLRDMRPLAYLIAPLFATILLALGDFRLLYIVLSFVVLSIIPIIMHLRDTRHEKTI